VVELNDDGRGLDTDAIRRTALKRGVVREEELAAMTPAQVQRLIFAPGFSTRSTVSDLSGRGVGLDVVRTNVDRLKGSLDVISSPGQGCTFRLQCPITLATTRVLLVQVDGLPYALPVEFVEGTRLVRESDLFRIEARETIRLEGQAVSVARLGDLLELGPGVSEVRSPGSEVRSRGPVTSDPGLRTSDTRSRPCVVLAIDEERLGIFVDQLLDEQEIMLKPLGPLLRRVRNVAGATILGTGEVCMVLNPHDLLRSVQKRRPAAALASSGQPGNAAARKKAILLAEDSLTTRTQEKRILESAGYQVAVAVDGVDALNQLVAGDFDALVTDVEMPNMDGFTLTARVRQDARYRELPVILVTSLASDEHRRQGIEAGANAYVTKNSFDQKALLETLRRLV
jgi:two-component system chemotaxis sensor kinase CheA